MRNLNKILLLFLCVLGVSCVSLNKEKNNSTVRGDDDFYLKITWAGLASCSEEILYLNSDKKSFYLSELKRNNYQNFFPHVKKLFDTKKWPGSKIPDRERKQFYSRISTYRTFDMDPKKIADIKAKVRSIGLMHVTQEDIARQEEKAKKRNPGLRIEDGTGIIVEVFLDKKFNGLIIENFYSEEIFLLLDYLRQISPEYNSLLEEPQNDLLSCEKLWSNSKTHINHPEKK